MDIRNWISALRKTAETLKTTVRPTDTIARFDQDNFHNLVEDNPNKDIPGMVASHIRIKLNERLTDPGNKVQFPIGVSILLCDGGYENIDEILQDANTVRSLGKLQAEGSFEFYDRTSITG